MKLMTVVGTRPQFIKSAMLILEKILNDPAS
jgi:UDP-N-acetylglucosamine 2-epimerase